MNDITLFYIKFNVINKSFETLISYWFIFIVIFFVLLFYFIQYHLNFIKNKNLFNYSVDKIKLRLKLGITDFEYSIQRNYQNIEIAHRIYIELITRKAALEVDESDVIIEVYNSWYSLFQITREEIKKINGKSLKDSKETEELIKLLTDTLNKGLRPHLTKNQAKFRKWYANALIAQENIDKSPQEIQKEYIQYEDLFNSIKEVNKTLIEYSNVLKKIIYNNQ